MAIAVVGGCSFGRRRFADGSPDILTASRFVYLLKLRQGEAFQKHRHYLGAEEIVRLTLRDIEVRRFGVTVEVDPSQPSTPIVIRGIGPRVRYCIDAMGAARQPGSAPPTGDWPSGPEVADAAMSEAVRKINSSAR